MFTKKKVKRVSFGLDGLIEQGRGWKGQVIICQTKELYWITASFWDITGLPQEIHLPLDEIIGECME